MIVKAIVHDGRHGVFFGTVLVPEKIEAVYRFAKHWATSALLLECLGVD